MNNRSGLRLDGSRSQGSGQPEALAVARKAGISPFVRAWVAQKPKGAEGNVYVAKGFVSVDDVMARTDERDQAQENLVRARC